MNMEKTLQSRELVKRIPWFEVILVIVVMAIHIYAATSDAYNFPASWFTRDDAYYYFKVAQNISEGHGSTFDGVGLTNGYHPLWMLVCIPIFALARFDLILPLRILLLVQAALSAATAVLIYRLIKSSVSEALGIIAASWWAFNWYIHGTLYQMGLESALASFTATLLIYQLLKMERSWRTSPLTRRQVIGLAIFALLALFSRLDLVFFALLAGLWIIFRGTPIRTLLPLDALLATVSVLMSFIIRLGLPDYYTYTAAALTMVAVSVITKILLYFFLGLYQPSSAQSVWRELRQIILAVAASSLITSGVMIAASSPLGGFPRIALLYDFGFNLAGMILLRLLARFFSQNKNRERVSPLELLKSKWKSWLEEGMIYYGIVGIPLVIYMLANKVFIGTAMPVSGEIKRWWASFGLHTYGGVARNLFQFWAVDFVTEFNAWRPLTFFLDAWHTQIGIWRGSTYKIEFIYGDLVFLVAIVWLAALAFNRHRAVRAATQLGLPLLFTASWVQIISYNALGYASMKEWYWITEPLFLVLAFMVGVGILLKPFLKIPYARVGLLVAAVIISLPMARALAIQTIENMPHGMYHVKPPYIDVARFLEKHTPAGAKISMTGGGNVGYYIQGRTIVNMDGLINSPAYFEAFKLGKANDYMASIGLNYIFANPGILSGPPYRGEYKTGKVIALYGGKSLMEFTP
ncbi:MAG TPA: hypothetical protein VMT73_10585 [Anaerolineales bacterium]|nr:hypothetical protein [Anaerolineales bacterium]